MRRLATQLLRQLHAPSDLRTDGDLLEGFLARGAEDEFTELVRRHGPLVWGACRRVLPDLTDAEDAFQATFLVLVRRGRKLTTYPTIGPWLHRVAVWTARNVRRCNARRLAKIPLRSVFSATATRPAPRLDAYCCHFRSSAGSCCTTCLARADAAQRPVAENFLGGLSRGATAGKTRPRREASALGRCAPTGLASSALRAAVASRVAVAATRPCLDRIPSLTGDPHVLIKKATAASVALFAVFAFGGCWSERPQIVGVVRQEKAATSAELTLTHRSRRT